MSSATFSNKAIFHLALHKAELFRALYITFEILSILAEALSTAAGIYPNPLPLDISDGFKVRIATAALHEFLSINVIMHVHCDYVSFPLRLLAALQNLEPSCGDY